MSSPLCVLLVTPDYPPPPGGIQTLTQNLETGLNESSHTARVLHLDRETISADPIDFVPRRRLGYSFRSAITGRFVHLNAVYRRTKAAIRAHDPDVVHAMHTTDWPALVAAREHGLPAVLSTYALELGNEALAKRAISRADLVHSISRFTDSLVRDIAGQGTVDSRIIPPSIGIGAYRSARSESSGNSTGSTVLTVARLVDRKNVATIVEAWKRLDGRRSENDELVVVGDGPNRDGLVAAAADTTNIRFTGWVNEEEKRRLLATSDVFALVPRRFGFDVEGFGIVYIEAQAAGTPVIGSRHGGVPEAIGDAGLIVDDETDPDEVATAIETLLDDRERRAECESAAQARVDRFDISTVTTRHVAAYRHLLSRERATAERATDGVSR